MPRENNNNALPSASHVNGNNAVTSSTMGSIKVRGLRMATISVTSIRSTAIATTVSLPPHDRITLLIVRSFVLYHRMISKYIANVKFLCIIRYSVL